MEMLTPILITLIIVALVVGLYLQIYPKRKEPITIYAVYRSQSLEYFVLPIVDNIPLQREKRDGITYTYQCSKSSFKDAWTCIRRDIRLQARRKR